MCLISANAMLGISSHFILLWCHHPCGSFKSTCRNKMPRILTTAALKASASGRGWFALPLCISEVYRTAFNGRYE